PTMFRRAFMTSGVTLAASSLLLSESRGEAPAVRKLAFVAGVSEYRKHGLSDLKYAENDALDLAAELRKHGFDVLTVVGEEATLGKLTKDLSKFFNDTKKLSKEDVVLWRCLGMAVKRSRGSWSIHFSVRATRDMTKRTRCCRSTG
ncbi:MAG: caspase family protein, partial [Planctomycetota bacterium]